MTSSRFFWLLSMCIVSLPLDDRVHVVPDMKGVYWNVVTACYMIYRNIMLGLLSSISNVRAYVNNVMSIAWLLWLWILFRCPIVLYYSALISNRFDSLLPAIEWAILLIKMYLAKNCAFQQLC